MDGPALGAWLEVLDAITYYELLDVDPRAAHDELRAAFHLFAENFHPDAHLGRHPDEQATIGRIYRRGTEAWRVLSDPGLRARYDDAVAHGDVRPENLIVERDPSRSLAPPSLAGAGSRASDQVRASSARPFVLRAEELLGKGDPRQAKIQLVMAMHIDRNNPALETLATQLEHAIADAKKARR